MTSTTAFADVNEAQSPLINVLVLSADGLRRDLLEAGISGSSSVALVHGGGFWEGGAGDASATSFDVDVVVIDLNHVAAVERGLEIGHEFKALACDPAIVVLAGSSDILSDVRKRMIEVGPKWSFLTTGLITGLYDLVRIIASAANGMTIVDPGFFMDIAGRNDRDAILTRPLTARQIQVMELVSQGYKNEAIADKLEISLRTVEHHLNETYVSIKNCRSSEINARVYASRVFSEFFGLGHTGDASAQYAA